MIDTIRLLTEIKSEPHATVYLFAQYGCITQFLFSKINILLKEGRINLTRQTDDIIKQKYYERWVRHCTNDISNCILKE